VAGWLPPRPATARELRARQSGGRNRGHNARRATARDIGIGRNSGRRRGGRTRCYPNEEEEEARLAFPRRQPPAGGRSERGKLAGVET